MKFPIELNPSGVIINFGMFIEFSRHKVSHNGIDGNVDCLRLSKLDAY
jgi:hypothetical protein